VTVVEDCAHTMGARWDGVPSGRHGAVACYSMQTYKHVNSGEGGFLTTDDAEVAARAILLSGSYMLYARHRAAPGPEVFAGLRLEVPNISGRMDNLRAAILRPQLRLLHDRVARWRVLYDTLEAGLRAAPGVALIPRPAVEDFVGSSFQFRLPDWDGDRIAAYVGRCAARGVELKWFGAAEPLGFTSRYVHWAYAQPPVLPQTDRILAGLIDLRLPLTFGPSDAAQIARILTDEAGRNDPAAAAVAAD
jgi:dTDP-4-amino-4,6-dideoxygalactose transaminase